MPTFPSGAHLAVVTVDVETLRAGDLEPRRLAKRYLWGNLTFMGRAVREAMIIRRSRNTASV